MEHQNGDVLEVPSYFSTKLDQVGNIGIYLAVAALVGLVLSLVFMKTKRSEMTVKIAKYTHSAYGHLLLTLIGIFWASIVSVFGSKLQQQWFEGKPWGAENLFFGFSVILASVLSVLHYIYSQVKEQENQSRLSFDSINESSVQTVNSMNIVNSCILDLQNIVKLEKNKPGSILGDPEKSANYDKTLDNAVETCMKSILLVTKRVNEGNYDVNVKANIFNLIPARTAQESFLSGENHKQENSSIFTQKSIDSSPFFLFSSNLNSRVEHCDYVLACDQNYTCEIDRNDKFKKCIKEQSGDIPAICMPVSHDCDWSIKLPHPNLFGAPEAIISKREVYVDNINEHVDLFFKELTKSPKYRDHKTGYYEKNIRSYYEKDKDKPKSILSIPLSKFEIDINKLDDFEQSIVHACVVNIYVNRVNFLENEFKSEAFCSMLKPLCHNLSLLISLKIAYANILRDYTIKNPSTSLGEKGGIVNG
jgi:hypothetical protein